MLSQWEPEWEDDASGEDGGAEKAGMDGVEDDEYEEFDGEGEEDGGRPEAEEGLEEEGEEEECGLDASSELEEDMPESSDIIA